MLDEEILELRRKLNESITKEKDYTYIYTLSLELDELITQSKEDGVYFISKQSIT